MIDPALADALSRIASRANDVMHGYDPAFRPQSSDVARRAGPGLVADADPLSVAAPPGSYFVVRDKDGRSVLTQDGGFHFVAGSLRGRDGAVVLGFAGKGAPLGPIGADPVDVALKRVSDPRIDKAGFVSCRLAGIDPVTGATRSSRAIVGRVALAMLPAGTAPLRVDGAHVRAPAGSEPRIGVPGDAGFGGITTYVRVLSAVDVEAGLDRLREAYLAFDALQAAHRSTGDVEKAAMDLLK